MHPFDEEYVSIVRIFSADGIITQIIRTFLTEAADIPVDGIDREDISVARSLHTVNYPGHIVCDVVLVEEICEDRYQQYYRESEVMIFFDRMHPKDVIL